MHNQRVRRAVSTIVEDEGGAAIVIIVASLLVLLLFTGLATDVPIAMGERRSAQNAADNAALAAAYAACTGADEADAVAAGETSATRNGYTDGAGAVTVAVTAGSGANEYMAAIDSTTSSFFSRIIGIDTFAIGVTASADCTASAGNAYAMFAIGDRCVPQSDKDQISISGSNNTINGATHSNGNLYIGGSDNDFGTSNPGTDEVTYILDRDNDSDKHGDQDFDPGQPQDLPNSTASLPDPVNLNIADYRPAANPGRSNYYSFSGDIGPDDIRSNGPGIYYTAGNIELDDSLTANVTLVAEGEISFNGSSQNLTAFTDGLLAFSNFRYSNMDDRCSKFVIKMEGSNNDWQGVIYAPRGQIEFAGSSNTAVTGSLVGDSIAISGSDVSITADDDASGSDPVSRLTQ